MQEKVILAMDRMEMNALHIFICDPTAASELIDMVLMALDPTIAAMENRHGTTPIDLFLELQGINVEHGEHTWRIFS